MNITVAVATGAVFRGDVSVKAPVPQMGTLAPRVQEWVVPIALGGVLGGYSLWEGSVELGVVATGDVTVDVISGGRVVDKAVF